jgi:hypothetical protein
MPDDKQNDVLVAEITARLRRSCDDVTEDAFATLVHTIAEATRNYDGAPPPAGFALRAGRPPAAPLDGADPD